MSPAITQTSEDIHDNSFDTFIDQAAVADSSETLGEPSNGARQSAPGGTDHLSSAPQAALASHHSSRHQTPFFPGLPHGTDAHPWNTHISIGTPTSLPTSLPGSPKFPGHLPTGSASAGRSPAANWRQLSTYDYDTDLTFSYPESSTAFGSTENSTATTDSGHMDLHGMPGLSYESMQTHRHPPVPPQGLFPTHAFRPELQDVAKWTQGVPYGSDIPGMMASSVLSADTSMLPPQLGALHRKSFDASQMSGLDAAAAAAAAASAPSSVAGSSHHAMHGRSMSLNMAGSTGGHHPGAGPGTGLAVGTGACSSDDMLSAQAPPMSHTQPFAVKAESSDAQIPLGGLTVGDAPTDNTSGPNNRKRKADAEASPATKNKPKSRARDNSPTKKAPRRRPTKSQNQIKEESAAPETAFQNASQSSVTQEAHTITTEPPANTANTPGDTGPPTGDNDQDKTADTDGASVIDADKGENTDGTNADASANSRRKPAQRAKRPPPSASQFTESGKPFPVVDTSATHSTLFVPPDVSGLTRREARLVKNRAAAFLSRQRKREQFEELEKQVGGMSRLVWKMWHAVAGTEAKFSTLPTTALQQHLDGEGREVFDYLEQVLNAEGASIAPTEESIANAAAAVAGQGNEDNTSSTPAESESNAPSSGASPGSGSGSVSQKPASNASGTNKAHSAAAGQVASKEEEIAKLRSQLEIAKQHAATLHSALVEERTKSSASSTSGSSSPSSTLYHPYSNVVQPGGPLAPLLPTDLDDKAKSASQLGGTDGDAADAFLAQSEQFFHEGRSERGGLSLTVAPEISAVQVDDAGVEVRQPVEAGAVQSMGVSKTSEAQSVLGVKSTGRIEYDEELTDVQQQADAITKGSLATCAGNSGKRTSGGMALMALFAGLALIGTGNSQGPQDPTLGVSRLASDFAG